MAARSADPCSLRQLHGRIDVTTRPESFAEITREVVRWLGENDVGDGLVTLFIQHTSASLTIQENADPDVLRDLLDALDRLAPRRDDYRHGCEGPDDMPAHIRTMLTASSLSVPVIAGRAALGTWQGIYLIEHRARGRPRSVLLHYVGT